MIAITKGMVVLSAAISAGFVTAYDMVASPAQEPAAIQVAQRFPAADEMLVAMAKPANIDAALVVRGDRVTPADNCTRQDWPYIAQTCLVSVDGKPVRRVNRIITVERRTGDNSSELTRVPVTTVANR
jgi:hypothetical protein